LAVDEIRVLTVPLEHPPHPVEELIGHLTVDERERADRFRVEKPRHQFITTRGLLRLTLGKILGMAPEKAPIGYTGAGKPFLQGISDAPHFNVAHTDGLALIALAKRTIGVDVERVRAIASLEGLVGRFFSSAEQECYHSLDPAKQLAGFFRAWTCKEALLKAVGSSVAYLDLFDVELHPDRPAKLLATKHPGLAGAEWHLAALDSADGYVAAVAVVGAGDIMQSDPPND
jgi:4'-phosphopantetheinyl transferase